MSVFEGWCLSRRHVDGSDNFRSQSEDGSAAKENNKNNVVTPIMISREVIFNEPPTTIQKKTACTFTRSFATR